MGDLVIGSAARAKPAFIPPMSLLAFDVTEYVGPISIWEKRPMPTNHKEVKRVGQAVRRVASDLSELTLHSNAPISACWIARAFVV
jgi:hypothetical protein